MIEPTEKDIGRAVVYKETNWNDKASDADTHASYGIIERFNKVWVYVRFGDNIYPMAMSKEDLSWYED